MALASSCPPSMISRASSPRDPLEQKPTPRDLANDLAFLNHPARLANDAVFPHLSLAATEYWFSTLATLLLPGDAGFSRSDRLAVLLQSTSSANTTLPPLPGPKLVSTTQVWT
eukprot:1026565-Pleurochrysis_carterae.AAC.4